MTNINNLSADIKSPSVDKILTRAFEELRIVDTKIKKGALDIMKKAYPNVSTSKDLWLNVMKAIVTSTEANDYILSKSELCDFLTIGCKGLEPRREPEITNGSQPINRLVDDAILSIYKDIMENYDASNDMLKNNYPRLVLNISSIVHKGTDLSGERVGVYGLERYYQRIKNDALNNIQSFPMALMSDVQKVTKGMDSIPEKHQSEISLKPRAEILPKASRKDLINSLSILTRRKKKELEELLMNLSEQDYKKITDLGLNYHKLQKYSKLVGSNEFSREVEKEIGKKLTDRQLQHATISIRKARTYIENVLDGKFVPHGSHGINHVKHNLEYGYQLMGLIEYKRRKHESTS
ncbi:MAG TPA: hypothetical protein VF884_08455 [Nitrososphaeraceae archaeon]